MHAAPKYYAALRPATLRIHDFVPKIRTSFHKMKELYADSTFPGRLLPHWPHELGRNNRICRAF